MSKQSHNQREIVLVPFSYSDIRTTKKRPVLIVSNDAYNRQFDDVIVCVIPQAKKKRLLVVCYR